MVSAEVAKEVARAEETGVAGDLLKAIAEPPDETASLDGLPGAPSESALVFGGGGCGSKPVTKSKTLSLSTSIDEKLSFGQHVKGTVSAKLDGSGSVTGEVLLNKKRKKVLGICVPYGVEFVHARLFGSATIKSKSDFNATMTVDYQWEDQIAKPPLGSLDFVLGVVPVHIGFNLPIRLGLDVKAFASASLHFDGGQEVSGSFDYTCTLV